MKTLRNHLHFSSRGKALDLHAPTSWGELSQKQLRYVFALMSQFSDPITIKTYMFFRLSGIGIDHRLPGGMRCFMRSKRTRQFFNIASWQVQSLLHQFDFIDNFDSPGVRLDAIRGCHAVDVVLHRVSFVDYLNAELCFQGFMTTKDPERLNELGRILYRTADGNAPASLSLSPAESTGVLAWYIYIKSVFARQFRSFFKPCGEVGDNDILQLVNAQIRALTDGDVTKKKEIMQIDCWDALTELNEKAREAAELKAAYGK